MGLIGDSAVNCVAALCLQLGAFQRRTKRCWLSTNSGHRNPDNTMQAALVVIILLAILAGAVFVGHYGWSSAGDVVMPAWGWMMLGLGVFFTLLVGGGLMALVFYSSREGFDEPPELAQKKKRRAAKWTKIVPKRKKTAHER